MSEFERLEPDWVSPEEALRRILDHATPLAVERVPLLDALGRALAEPADATATLPPWDNSAMDGYAVRAEDTRSATADSPIRLPVREESRPGPQPTWSIAPGEAARIMTGAPLPRGTDAVVRVEDTNAAPVGESVEIRASAEAGQNVRGMGEDLRAGDRALEAGTEIGPGQAGVLAALGMTTVPVRRRPRIGILTSGDEIVDPSEYEAVRAGRAIPDSAGWALRAAVLASGGEPVALGNATDNADSIRAHVRRAHHCDALVTIGGASMGAGDLFKRTLLEEGLELVFWRIRMRPGSPTSFGLLPRGAAEGGEGARPLPVFGLPGNPASAFVTFHLFARPFIRALTGHRIHRLPAIRAIASEKMKSPERLTQYVRVRIRHGERGPVASLTGSQSSGLVRSLGLAHGLAVLPEGTGGVEAREPVEVLLLSGPPSLGLAEEEA